MNDGKLEFFFLFSHAKKKSKKDSTLRFKTTNNKSCGRLDSRFKSKSAVLFAFLSYYLLVDSARS